MQKLKLKNVHESEKNILDCDSMFTNLTKAYSGRCKLM